MTLTRSNFFFFEKYQENFSSEKIREKIFCLGRQRPRSRNIYMISPNANIKKKESIERRKGG